MCLLYPLKPSNCEREDCFPCSKEGGGDYSRSCAAYRMECLECENNNISAIYHGETGRNGYSHGLEHYAGLKKTTHCGNIALFSTMAK